MSGGGAKAVQNHTGALLALRDYGVKYDVVSGTSGGGLVALCAATCMPPDVMRDVVAGLGNSDVQDRRWFWRLRTAMKATSSIHRPDTVRRTIARILPRSRTALKMPCHVWGVDAESWDYVDLCAPELGMDLHQAALAKMSAPGFLPAMPHNGRYYLDGGLRYNVPLADDWYEHFTSVWVLVASGRGDNKPGYDLLTNSIRALNILMWDQTDDVLRSWPLRMAQASKTAHVIHYPQSDVGIFDFQPGAIEAGYAAVRDYMEGL